ncbi:hypothetical protein DYB37_002644 [Aphanomyces astaci]|uniref:Uncharacterized protein n=1 Tax=Aphanomyces astaci TaxID=112090 RepID=A0A3R6XPQ6_APHAT|nr:hypothetical protein DYB37_002644 [Aphanomyces astaci]
MATYTLDDLVVAVVKSFEELECTVLDKTFMTLQKVMECIFKMGGDNDFKLPHQKKHGLVKEGLLPTRLECDEDVCAAVDAMEERMSNENPDKPPKRTKKLAPQAFLWCDQSVSMFLFALRYNSHLASRFDSKNNYGKRVAYVMLAAEFSVEMQREFTAKQVQDKV